MSYSHTVPQVYLKLFRCSDSDLFTYNTVISNSTVKLWEAKKIKSTSVIPGIYAYCLESYFGESIENDVKPVFDKITNNTKMNSMDYKVISDFIALQKLRTYKSLMIFSKNKDLRSIYIDGQEKLKKDIIRGAKSKKAWKKARDSEVTTDKKIFPHNVRIGLTDKEYHVELSTSVLQQWNSYIETFHKIIAKELYKQHWHIFRADDSFFTSDDPVVIFNSTDGLVNDFFSFLKIENVVLLPVGSNHIIFTVIGKDPPFERAQFADSLHVIRTAIALNAYRQIYSNKIDPTISSLRNYRIDQKFYTSFQNYKKYIDKTTIFEGIVIP